ncbi:FIG01132123: hypothetical protein [Streptomyces venezuelae]|nr:FIG01132123: hypothetical protein [Streptomyces venezuelae]
MGRRDRDRPAAAPRLGPAAGRRAHLARRVLRHGDRPDPADAPHRDGDPARQQPHGHALPCAGRAPVLARHRHRPRGHRFTQVPPNRHRTGGWDDYAVHPEVREFTLDTPGRWTRLDGDGDVDVKGRLIGGCIEMLCNLAGTPYLDASGFARSEAPEGLLVYVEAGGDDSFAICRYLHGMRLAGFFDRANAVLVGRTSAPGHESLSQHEAVLDALAPLNVPIIADVECGHVAPYLPIVNGARGRVVHTATHSELTQTLD